VPEWMEPTPEWRLATDLTDSEPSVRRRNIATYVEQYIARLMRWQDIYKKGKTDGKRRVGELLKLSTTSSQQLFALAAQNETRMHEVERSAATPDQSARAGMIAEFERAEQARQSAVGASEMSHSERAEALERESELIEDGYTLKLLQLWDKVHNKSINSFRDFAALLRASAQEQTRHASIAMKALADVALRDDDHVQLAACTLMLKKATDEKECAWLLARCFTHKRASEARYVEYKKWAQYLAKNALADKKLRQKVAQPMHENV
jgi:hypothetical protein